MNDSRKVFLLLYIVWHIKFHDETNFICVAYGCSVWFLFSFRFSCASIHSSSSFWNSNQWTSSEGAIIQYMFGSIFYMLNKNPLCNPLRSTLFCFALLWNWCSKWVEHRKSYHMNWRVWYYALAFCSAIECCCVCNIQQMIRQTILYLCNGTA